MKLKLRARTTPPRVDVEPVQGPTHFASFFISLTSLFSFSALSTPSSSSPALHLETFSSPATSPILGSRTLQHSPHLTTASTSVFSKHLFLPDRKLSSHIKLRHRSLPQPDTLSAATTKESKDGNNPTLARWQDRTFSFQSTRTLALLFPPPSPTPAPSFALPRL